MSDDDFLELFSNFLTSIRIHDVGDSKRHAILHEAEGALCSIMSNNGIVASLEKQPSRASGSDGSISDSDRRVLEKIGRAILTEHPDHLKMREILELLDGDKDGRISATDLQNGLKIHMNTELSMNQIESMIELFDKNRTGKLHYFQLVQLLQIAMQNAIEDEDKIIHTPRPSFLANERELLDQIGAYVDSSPHAGLIKDLFFHLSKTYAHLVTSHELLEFCRRSGIRSATQELVDRIVEHFNPRSNGSSIHALSYAQFARLCSESANRNFKTAPEIDNPAICPSAEENLSNRIIRDEAIL